MSGLVADFRVQRAEFTLELALDVAPGGITAVVGPNGSGKTTTLRTLAGLLWPLSGRIELNGRVLDDVDTDAHVTASARDTGVVFQDYLLFPHLSVADNVAFGLVARGQRSRQARSAAGAWLERLAIGDLAAKRPGELSGGQAQRVALARALVLEPPLLLLDEPMSALDASTRVEVRNAVAAQLSTYSGATVLVTHDAADALALADHTIVLERGRVVQRGPTRDVAAAPVNAYVAGLFAHATD